MEANKTQDELVKDAVKMAWTRAKKIEGFTDARMLSEKQFQGVLDANGMLHHTQVLGLGAYYRFEVLNLQYNVEKSDAVRGYVVTKLGA